jgi:class 3 adenylate cyclase
LCFIHSTDFPQDKNNTPNTLLKGDGMQQNAKQIKSNALDVSQMKSERFQNKLDACEFHLKTLNDISKDIYGSVETDTILKNFLLMSMGNFGIIKGFVLLMGANQTPKDQFVSIGFQENEVDKLRHHCKQCAFHGKNHDAAVAGRSIQCREVVPHGIEDIFPFLVEPDSQGILGLGPRLMADNYTASEQELLETLINSLVVALTNAKSFESMADLNQSLEEKNSELSNALIELKAEMRKNKILESVKDNLSKFVPIAVSQAIKESPTGSMPDSKTQDLSVLFLDIEGYTRLCEKLGGSKVNTIIEKHFSVFMDAIHANNGDVNETAGDGLMVLFLSEDKQTNALEAAQTALTIQKETVGISKEIFSLYKPLEINIGINSGSALVGAAKFESIAGSRWTYTARGSLINIAARIGALASGGQTLVSKSTAQRIAGQHLLKDLGKFELKNVKDKVDVFQLC